MLTVSSVSNNRRLNSIKNNPTFSAMTDNGNEYQKTNAGKKAIPAVFAAQTLISGAILAKASKGISKGVLAVGTVIGAAVMAVLGLGVGAIVDAISNRTIRKDADKYAETGNIPQNTNHGKRNGLGIGLGLCLISLLRGNKETPAFNKAFSFALTLAAYTFYGGVYDHSVNKFRENLQNPGIPQQENLD